MKLLVTGGTGFIGSHLAEEGRRRGAAVVVLGLNDRTEERANAELLARQGVEILPGSITDAELCQRAIRGVTHVFHLAVAMREGGKSDEFFERVNLDGTQRLLEAAGVARVQRFVYCGTIGIYGHRAPGITTEKSPLRPGNAYERTKVAAERLVRELAPGAAVPFTILRPADVYGPRDQRLLKLFRGVSRGRFPLFGNGRGRRHMVYVEDVVAAFFAACERPEAAGESMIVAGPRPCTLAELIEEVRRATGSRRFGLRLPLAPMLATAAVVEDVCQALNVDPPIYRRRMDFFTSDSAFDTAHAQRVLGWSPRVELAEGVQRTADDYRRSGALGWEPGAVLGAESRSTESSRHTLGTSTGGATEPWQIQLFRRSLKKRQTVDAMLGHLPPVQGKLCLELGCGTGLTSHFLRERGGTWVSADFERDHVRSARQLVRDRVLQVGDRQLPFATASFDVVAAVNFLEHIKDDETFVAEMVRVLKPGGDFLFMAPKGDPGRPGYLLKRLLGFTADQEGFGHARDGYPKPAARALMERHGIRVQGQETYCRFFTESLEDLLNYAYHRKAMQAKDTKEQDFHGDTAPMSADALNKVGTAYKVYSVIYPALRAWTMLDRLIPFSEGYMMVTWGKKAA